MEIWEIIENIGAIAIIIIILMIVLIIALIIAFFKLCTNVKTILIANEQILEILNILINQNTDKNNLTNKILKSLDDIKNKP